MKFTRIYHISFCFFFLFLSCFVFSQSKIEVKVEVDRKSILIGEPINYSVQVSIPKRLPPQFFSIDTIPHFEFLETGKIDTSVSETAVLLKQVFKITSFDSGRWAIPSFFLRGNIRTDTFMIDVGFAPFDRNKDYNDIKEILEAETHEAKRDWTWYLIVGTVLLLLIIYLLLRKKPKPQPKPEPAINVYNEAMDQLEKLRREDLPAKGEVKMFYSRLTEIFRIYLLKKKQILSLQKTTDDLVLQIKSLNLDPQLYNQLAQALRLSDFVKFAKYHPTTEDHQLTYSVIKNSIEAIERTHR